MELLEGNTVQSYIMKERGEVQAITATGTHKRHLSPRVGEGLGCLNENWDLGIWGSDNPRNFNVKLKFYVISYENLNFINDNS